MAQLKHIFITLVTVIGLMTGCSEDVLLPTSENGVPARITVGIPNNAFLTRSNTIIAGTPLLTNMRVTLFVSSQGNVVAQVQQTGQDLSDNAQITFDVQLVPNKTYNIAVWADFGDGYYTLPEIGNTPVVSLKSTSIGGNDNHRDAYFATKDTFVTSSDNMLNLTLKRPFALVKINTNNWSSIVAANRPNHYSGTFSSYSQINLLTGALVGDKVAITTSGTITGGSDATQELSFDYLLAPETATTLPDFTMNYTGGSTNYSYTFKNIPIQRNYVTNISGAILATP